MNTLVYIFIYVTLFCIIVKLNSYHKNHNKCDFSYYKDIYINYSVLFVLTLLVINNNYASDYKYSCSVNLFIIIIYFLIADSLTYWYHRTVHRQPILKKYVHSTHHDNYQMVPLDALNASYLEILCDFLMVFLIPTFILQPNFVESIIIYGIVVSHIAYKHMDEEYGYFIPYFINANYHTKHHEIGGGNYGQFFIMWDFLMNTLILKREKKEIRENKEIREKKEIRENKEIRKKKKKLKTNKSNDKIK